MTAVFAALAVVVFLSVLASLVGALRACTRVDAMLAVQLAGTGAVGVLLLAGPATVGLDATLDLALVLAALAAVTAIAFVAFGWTAPAAEPPPAQGHDDCE